MLKERNDTKRNWRKRIFSLAALAGLVMVTLLSGCGNDTTKQDSADMVVYEEEQFSDQEIGLSGETIADNTSKDAEIDATVKEEKADTVNTETKSESTKSKPAKNEPTESEPAHSESVESEPESQPQAETSVALTDKGKAFLVKMCSEMNDFSSGQAMDEKFWRDFLLHSYTGGTVENAVTEQVYREDLGFEETVVKISVQEAQERVKLAFGAELPDLKPSFEDMERGQTSFYYKDGYYYIGVSDQPDYRYTFSESAADKENDVNTIVKYTIDYMGESNVGTVTFSISPENNENGFVVRSKTTELVK